MPDKIVNHFVLADGSVARYDYDELLNAPNIGERVFKQIKINELGNTTHVPGYYGTVSGSDKIILVPSSNMDSYVYYAQESLSLYVDESYLTSVNYASLCIVENAGELLNNTITGDTGTAHRYRKSDGNMPTINTPLQVPAGSALIFTETLGANKWVYFFDIFFLLAETVVLGRSQIQQVKNEIINSRYSLTYTDGVLNIAGEGIECSFSDLTFNNAHGVFELQNLTYNGSLVFGSDSDYLGPVRVNGESIKGCKHGDETTDVLQIIADGNSISNGDSVECSEITIYVESTISGDEFKRCTIWSLANRKLTVNSVIKTLKPLSIDYIFGCGILSVQNDIAIAWLNKDVLTSDVLTGLNPITSIVTTSGTLVSERLSVSSDYGERRIAFIVYSNRKKLYYYNCYGNNISIPEGTVFSSIVTLSFS